MKYLHWVSKTHPGYTPFDQDSFCQRIWIHLRRLFPDPYACILMPNHLHIITRETHVEPMRQKLNQLLGQHTAYADLNPKIWVPTPAPSIIPDHKHLLRQVRYVHLNPSRSRLSNDPLKWLWTTHRDYLNLVNDPWCGLRQLNSQLKHALTLKQFHHYVSADSTTKVNGTPYPASVPRTEWNYNVSPSLLKKGLDVYFRRPDPNQELRARILKLDLMRTNKSILEELKISKATLYNYMNAPESSEAILALCTLLGDTRLTSKK